MSTPNFMSVNTNKIYAFGMNQYFTKEDFEEGRCDEEQIGEFDELGTQFNFECDSDNAFYELKAKGWGKIDEWNRNSSYPGHYFAEKTAIVDYGRVSLKLIVKASSVSGYYEGATFDVDAWLSVYHDGYCVMEDYDLYGRYAVSESDVIDDDWFLNKGLCKIHAKNIIKKVYDEMEKLQSEAEEVFQMYSDYRLVCGGIFSNGEAIYYDTESESRREQLKAQLASA